MVRSEFRRPLFELLLERVRQPRMFVQVLAGPRQVGKTTLARQVLQASELPSYYASADDPTLRDRAWLETQWALARIRAREGGARGGLLVLDEAQKITAWSEVVKRLWDEDTAAGLALRVVLLGSAPLLVQRGLTESLAGRFELIRVPHWSFAEMRTAFGWDLDRYIYHGGYPGAAALVGDHERWVNYIVDSLVETTISRDVLLLSRVDKPALLRQLFRLGCDYSGQILSYQKMLGELQDAGNTVTLAHYLELLASAGLIVGLQKFAGARVRQRGSSPKLLVRNTALMSAFLGMPQTEARRMPEIWGRLVESTVGAHLCNSAGSAATETFYWREKGKEVDYVVRSGRSLAAIEVKTGARWATPSGLAEFTKTFHPDRALLVGENGIPLADFLSEPVESWL
jgi:uncharacterized protein